MEDERPGAQQRPREAGGDGQAMPGPPRPALHHVGHAQETAIRPQRACTSAALAGGTTTETVRPAASAKGGSGFQAPVAEMLALASLTPLVAVSDGPCRYTTAAVAA